MCGIALGALNVSTNAAKLCAGWGAQRQRGTCASRSVNRHVAWQTQIRDQRCVGARVMASSIQRLWKKTMLVQNDE